MAAPIVDLRPDAEDLVDQAAVLLQNAFRNRTEDWQDVESARQEVLESFAPDRISRVYVDESRTVLGWIGAIPTYAKPGLGNSPAGRHRIASRSRHRASARRRPGALVAGRGGLTLWVGSDDENNETTLSATDLYPDIPGALRGIRNLGQHPFEFYLRLGFRIAGVLPDANGRGKPDIFLAKRVGA